VQRYPGGLSEEGVRTLMRWKPSFRQVQVVLRQFASAVSCHTPTIARAIQPGRTDQHLRRCQRRGL